MSNSQLTLVLLVHVVSSAVGVKPYLEGPNQYTECVYNTYKATCLGTNINKRECTNCGLQEFPVLTKAENCVMLHGNLIRKFPDDLLSIKQVRTLDLSSNKLETLPDNLDVLTELDILDLSKNQLRTLSPKTRFPHMLRGLLLAGNEMTTIPAGIEVPGLFVLDLSQNQFTEIPFHFCVSSQLIRVDFTRNPLQHDVSYYLKTLNRCRNMNTVPFCLFIDRRDFACNCPTLYPVLFETPAFCMATRSRSMGIECDAQSSAGQFGTMTLYDVDKKLDFVRKNCSFAELGSLGGRGETNRASMIVAILSMCIVFMHL